MSRKKLHPKDELELWVKAGGRCQYEGCNKPLLIDPITLSRLNHGYKAHVIADSPNGPRGDQTKSPLLQTDIQNLMLLCDACHRRIDGEGLEDHPADRLLTMKQQHEERIALLTNISPEMKTEVLFYGAKIGAHSPLLSMKKTAQALIPERYPQTVYGINLSMRQEASIDSEALYWQMEESHLVRMFESQVKPRLREQSVNHLSIFGLAPQPLLIRLGTLLSDIPEVDVYQLHREPQDWRWQEHPTGFNFKIIEPENTNKHVEPALVFALSANISLDRVYEVLSPNCAPWIVTIDSPNNDFLKSRHQLRQFREVSRYVLNQIKSGWGRAECIHVFPAMPVAASIELGRVWMPKADLPLKIYDENGGFKLALNIGTRAVMGAGK